MFSSPRLQPARYLALEDTAFFRKIQPNPLNAPRLLQLNAALAMQLGLTKEDFAPINFSHWLQRPALPDRLYPVATAYSGHQFGGFNPHLGDGRALLLGEIEDDQGVLWEVQLKGCGPTPYSRGFDGRAVLRSVVREYLASEAMVALGIPTTRALAILISDTPVSRERWEPAAAMLRLAPSHIRFGHFEHFSARQQYEQLEQLLMHTLEHHFPHLFGRTDAVECWFIEVVERTARLMADWQALGFCHGVMNTDNFSVLGLTLDYGPYGFMEAYAPNHICNHSDSEGRYAFNQQPGIGLWNLHCLAQALTPLLNVAHLKSALARYDRTLQAHYLNRMRQRLGIHGADDEDEALIASLLVLLEQQRLDYNGFMRDLARDPLDGGINSARGQRGSSNHLTAWIERYRSHNPSPSKTRLLSNPGVILRNHLAQDVICAAEAGNSQPLETLMAQLTHPFATSLETEQQFGRAPGRQPITVSCSS